VILVVLGKEEKQRERERQRDTERERDEDGGVKRSSRGGAYRGSCQTHEGRGLVKKQKHQPNVNRSYIPCPNVDQLIHHN